MPRYNKQKQRGGRVSMPLRYFDPDANVPAYYATGSPQLTCAPTAYGPYKAVSHGVASGPGFPRSVGPNLAPAPDASNLQTGGGYTSPYDKITNPATGRRVSIYTKKGKEVLSQYVNTYRNIHSYH